MHRLPDRLTLFVVAGSLSIAACASAANLVPNGDFETYTTCPTSFGNLSVASPWNVPNTGTSDYLNACAPVVFPSVNVPQNEQGYEPALSGTGYGGIIPLSAAPNYREYLEAPLSSPLVANASYLVRFHVSLADSSSLAIDRLGAYLSVGAVGPVPNYAALPFTPQVESPPSAFLTNANGWTLVSGVLVASGGEDHITIGNFHDDATTSTVTGPGQWPGGAYYYVDDVSVEPFVPTDQACCLPDGTCATMLPSECALLNGSPGGAGSSCTPSPCGVTKARKSTWGSLKTSYR